MKSKKNLRIKATQIAIIGHNIIFLFFSGGFSVLYNIFFNIDKIRINNLFLKNYINKFKIKKFFKIMSISFQIA